jgi:hypothetical protein
MRGRVRIVVSMAFCAVVLASVPVVRAQSGVFPGNLKAGVERLPEGAGKDALARLCTQCHSAEQIVNTRRTARQWKALAELMSSRMRRDPAPADVVQVIDYLQRNLARPETAEEAKSTDPLREPDARLPLSVARDLSGAWMTTSWYTQLNMGPGTGLPSGRSFRARNDPKLTDFDALTPWAKEKSKDWTIYNDPLARCYSPGPMAYNSPYPFEVLNSPKRITLIAEYFHEVRRVYMDGRGHPPDNPNPTVMGHSIGRWEGATLVVDTANFNESAPFRVPHSDQYHMIERMRRVRDGNLLEIDITLEDPVAYAQPLHGTFYFKKDPTIEFTEWNCDGMFDYRPHQPGAKTN